ncbi:MAG: hypothetical protein AAGN35_13035 [Bacteroidota bacterium]
MPRIICLAFLFAAMYLLPRAQSLDAAAHRALRRSLQEQAYNAPTPVMEGYAGLQQQEMGYFARDTFTMTWRMDPQNLSAEFDSTAHTWTVRFDPTWANGRTSPLPERYELRGNSCREAGGPGVYLEDLDLRFTLDEEFKILAAEPSIKVRREGQIRQLDDYEVTEIDLAECLKVTYMGEEYTKPFMVGRNFRKVQKMLRRAATEQESISQIIDRAVREKYAGFRILTLEIGYATDRVRWFRANALSETLTTYGRFTAATGPQELQFEVTVRFPEGEVAEVDLVRIFK